MLTQLRLDDEQYEDILEEARNVCARLYPQWTDYNFHDPGITILELFSLMKESQQYFLDQIGEKNRKMYLKLLGLHCQHKKPAVSLVKVDSGKEDVLLFQNMKFLAGELCFETSESRQIIGGDISVILAMRGETELDVLDKERMNFEERLNFLPFGQSPQLADCCYIGFERPLPVGAELMFYVDVYEDYPVQRNAVSEDFSQLVELELQYFAGEWRTLPFVDETRGFLFDGFCRFTLPEELVRTAVGEEEGYFLRVVLKSGVYDIAPEIVSFSMNTCRVYQRDTLVEPMLLPAAQQIVLNSQLAVLGRSDCYYRRRQKYYPIGAVEKQIDAEDGTAVIRFSEPLPEDADAVLIVNQNWGKTLKWDVWQANGFPEQEIDLEDLQVEYESLQLLVQDIKHEEAYRLWEKVPDFGSSAPWDTHYVFDSAKGILRFGDGVHGMPPEGEVILVGYARTFGTDGNVKQGKIDRFQIEGIDGVALSNIVDAAGGRDEETVDECFLRARQVLKRPDCAVTALDYEDYVMRTPGLMIEGCKLLHTKDMREFYRDVDECGIYLVVKPFAHRRGEGISAGYRRNLLGFLENYREVGSSIYILALEYVDVEIYIDVIVKPQYLHLEKRLNEAIKNYFADYGSRFGGTVSYSELYGYMERQEYVSAVRSMNLDVKGSAKRSRDGDIHLAPNAQLVLGRCKCTYTLKD